MLVFQQMGFYINMSMRWKLEHILKKTGGSILLEDDSILVINKPSGLLVLPDRYDHQQHNLYDLLKETIGTVYVVHRIDRETSGAVLFAKTAEAHAILNAAFEQRSIKKTYYAIVIGQSEADSGQIDLPIIEQERGIRKMKIDTRNGKEAFTAFTIQERFKGYLFVEARPLTGRTHQIRLHLSARGMPILADPLYGDGQGFFLSAIKRGYRRKEEELPLLARTALHAYALSVEHPVTHEQITVEAPLPRDMAAVLKALRKYQGEIGSRNIPPLMNRESEQG